MRAVAILPRGEDKWTSMCNPQVEAGQVRVLAESSYLLVIVIATVDAVDKAHPPS
jgi:hypothetical protein